MRKILVFGFLWIFMLAALSAGNTHFVPIKLSQEEITYLMTELESKNKEYDESEKMLFCITQNKHYHSDLDSGVVVHQTRESLEYAVALLKTENEAYRKRAIDIIETILPMQETDESLPYCGVWPYYPEDPLRGRKAAVDYNWADFIAVPLIDVLINHSDCIDNQLAGEIKDALVLAAKAIRKRDVQPDYTNMCIMGTYVCYVVGDMCGMPDMMEYARHRLVHFYNYVINNKGFTEYNSPTYTLVAMDELLRMQQTIVNVEDRKIIDELYVMCWEMIATHFHQPSGQWCGPNLRAYNSLATPEFYRLLYNASDGKINLPGDYLRIPNVIKPHHIPEHLLPYFLQSSLPRLEVDTFVVADYMVSSDDIPAKDIVGTLYMNRNFALASVNQGYMWNQTRPLIAHWGTVENPSYMQVRFLHDGYDFSAVNMLSAQDSTTVLAVFNISEDGGDTHPSLDRMTNGIFHAKDLRLRIEIGGNVQNARFFRTGNRQNEIYFVSPNLCASFKIPYVNWDNRKSYWKFSQDGQKIYADFVLYSGREKVIDLNRLQEAVLGLYVALSFPSDTIVSQQVAVNKDKNYLILETDNLRVKALRKPVKEMIIRNDYEAECFDNQKFDNDNKLNLSKK